MRCMFGMEGVNPPAAKRPRPRGDDDDGSLAPVDVGGAGAGGERRTRYPISPYIPPINRTGVGERLLELTEHQHRLCLNLPEWMNVLVESVHFEEEARRDPFAVFMNPRDAQYILGVCGAPITVTSQILSTFPRDHPFFMRCFPDPFMIELEIHENFGFNQTEQLREFCHNPQYQIALLSRSSASERLASVGDEFGHAGLLIKDTDEHGRLKLVITDPNGAYDGILTGDELMRYEVFIQAEVRKYVAEATVEHQVQHRDQAAVEGSCVAMAFMRMCYLLYCSFVENNERLVGFLQDPVPCVFAVFVSRLFQRKGIITQACHEMGTGEARRQLGDYSFVEQHAEQQTLDEIIHFLKQEGVRLRLHENLPTGVTLTSRIQNMIQHTYPGRNVSLSRDQLIEIGKHIIGTRPALPPAPTTVFDDLMHGPLDDEPFDFSGLF